MVGILKEKHAIFTLTVLKVFMFFRARCDLLSFQIRRSFVYGLLAYVFLLFVVGRMAVASSLELLLTYLLTPWSRVLLEKLTGLQLVKKFPAFYGTRMFITAFTSAVTCLYP
jgi:hypothetical protein